MASRKIQESKKKARHSTKLHILGMNDDLWIKICEVGSEFEKGCE